MRKSASTIRKHTRRALRDRIDGEKQLDRLEEIAVWLETHGKNAGLVGPDGMLPVVRPEQVVLAEKEVNLRLKLLNKVLPDLKAIEHSGEVDTGRHRSMSGTELKHRVGLIMNARENEAEEVIEMLPFLE